MNDYETLGITGYDHIEFAVNNVDKASELYLRMGFERVGTREMRERKLKSVLMGQGEILVLLSQSELPADPISKFQADHGDGIINIAFRCNDAHQCLETVIRRGATLAEPPKSFQKEFGQVEQTSIRAFGDVRHSFVTRKGQLFGEGFEIPFRSLNQGCGLAAIDHITTNVERGTLDDCAGFYEKVLGFKNTRFFDIHTERTGLYSKVMQSPDGVVKMPINIPTEDSSQIQEFLDINHGPGVQHLALKTQNIVQSLRTLRKEGLKFLEVPATYYEEVPKRVPNVAEDMNELQSLGILVDGSAKGYLLQIFTENLIGPFFYEVIQRKGDDGFGEGNFKALFEAIERDQIKRGVLK